MLIQKKVLWLKKLFLGFVDQNIQQNRTVVSAIDQMKLNLLSFSLLNSKESTEYLELVE